MIEWERTLWAVGLDMDGHVQIWTAHDLPQRLLAEMLRKIADGLEDGNLVQISPPAQHQ